MKILKLYRHFLILLLLKPCYISAMNLTDSCTKKLAEHLVNLGNQSNSSDNLKFLPMELNYKLNRYLISPKIIAFVIKHYLAKNEQYDFKTTSFDSIDGAHFYELRLDNQQFAIRTNRGIEIYKTLDQKLAFRLEDCDYCEYLSFCLNNSCILAIDGYQNLKLYDCKNGTKLSQTNSNHVKTAKFSYDDLFLAILYDTNIINIYSTESIKQSNLEEIKPIISITLKNNNRFPSTISWSPNNQFLAAIFKKSVELYEGKTGKLIFEKQFWGKKNKITSSISPDSKYIAIANNHDFKSYLYKISNKNADFTSNTETDDEIKSNIIFDGNHFNEILSLDFNFDGTKILETSYDGSAAIYNLNNLNYSDKEFTLEPEQTIKGFKDALLGAKFSPDGTLIAIDCYDGLIYIYGAHSAELLTKLEGHKIFNNNLIKFNYPGYLITPIESRTKINIYDLSFTDLKEKLYNLKPIEVLLLLESYKSSCDNKKLNLCSCKNSHFAKYYHSNKIDNFLYELINSHIVEKCDKCESH